MVGTSGRRGERSREVMASARSLPPAMCPALAPRLSTVIGTSPLITASSDCGVLR